MENIRKNIEKCFVSYHWNDMKLNTVANVRSDVEEHIQSGTWDSVLSIISGIADSIRWSMTFNLIKKINGKY